MAPDPIREARKGMSELTPDPIFQEDGAGYGKVGAWYYWDENWAVAIGPFDSRKEAEEDLKDYAASL